MVCGDGEFKDSVGKIWELIDSIVSPAYADGLIETPNVIKLNMFPIIICRFKR